MWSKYNRRGFNQCGTMCSLLTSLLLSVCLCTGPFLPQVDGWMDERLRDSSIYTTGIRNKGETTISATTPLLLYCMSAAGSFGLFLIVHQTHTHTHSLSLRRLCASVKAIATFACVCVCVQYSYESCSCRYDDCMCHHECVRDYIFVASFSLFFFLTGPLNWRAPLLSACVCAPKNCSQVC